MAKVIKLAQPGYDVKTANDQELIFNSNWPLLKIYMQGSFTITDYDTPTQTIVKHNLGYPPLFWYFTNSSINNWQRLVTPGVFSSDLRSEFQGITGSGQQEEVGANDTELRFCSIPGDEHTGSGDSGSLRIYYYIFAVNLNEQYTAPLSETGKQPTSRGGKTVFKIAKPTKDISSTKLEDYVIHSQARSPMIHSINPLVSAEDSSSFGGFTGYGATVNHNLGYSPMHFGFRKGLITLVDNISHFPDTYFPLYTAQSGAIVTSFQADENKIHFITGIPNRPATLVILKDPFDIQYKVNITI